MTDAISVAVMISTFNRAAFLRDCIDSVLAQSLAAAQIIVVDDGSDDGTEALCREYEDQIVYIGQENSGKSVALNRGMEAVTSSHICFFDDDDYMLPDALSAHQKTLRGAPKDAYSYSPHLVFADDGAHWIGDQRHWQPVRTPQHAEPGEMLVKTLEWGRYFLTYLQGMLIPVSLVHSLGGFDPDLLRGQDYDMMLRLAASAQAHDTQVASFVMRSHTGPRGPASDRHSSAQRFAVWHKYDRKIVLRYRGALSLFDYLSTPDVDQSLTAQERCRALIQKFDIMLSHSLYREACEDLDLLFGDGSSGPRTGELYEHISSAVTAAANFSYEFQSSQASTFAKQITKLSKHHRIPGLRLATARGMSWSAYRSLKESQWKMLSQVILAARHLL